MKILSLAQIALFLFVSCLATFGYAEEQKATTEAQTSSENEAASDSEKTRVWGCFFLVKKRLFGILEDPDRFLEGVETDITKLYKLMISDMFTRCLLKMDVATSQQILEDLSTKNLDEFESFKYADFIPFDLAKYSNPETLKVELTSTQLQFAKHFMELDEELRALRKESGEDYDTMDKQFADVLKTVSKFSGKTKGLYFLVVFGILGFAVYLAYSRLFGKNETAYEQAKRKKEMKKKNKAN